MKKEIKPSQGKILISEPSLIDFFFKQSVILLTEHNENGTFGLIINKPTHLKLSEVSGDFAGFQFPVYFGGPVSTNHLFYVHQLEDKIPESLKITDKLYWGGNIEIIKNLMKIKTLTTENIRFFIGYSGWEVNQLEHEVTEHSWLIATPTIEQIISNNPSALWPTMIKSFGKEYAIWANFPSDPLMN